MIAVRMLSRDEYSQFLRRFGCVLVVEDEILEDGIYGQAYWRTSWGFYFFVPEVNGYCPEHKFFEILAEVSKRQPKT